MLHSLTSYLIETLFWLILHRNHVEIMYLDLSHIIIPATAGHVSSVPHRLIQGCTIHFNIREGGLAYIPGAVCKDFCSKT